MTKGNEIMNYLRINKGKGQFMNHEGKYKDIDTINKEDKLFLLDEATKKDSDFEMEEMTKDAIKNEAHKIIYENISSKFKDLISKKDQFADESEALYKEALQKYRQ